MNKVATIDHQGELGVVKPQPTALDLLGAAIGGGITAENVAVVEKLVQMRRDEVGEQAKKAFAMAFFKLKKEIATMELFADKASKNGEKVMFTYCSEQELSKTMEPLLLRHGFATLTNQKKEGDLVTVTLTVIHEDGHSEDRSYSVRAGATNSAKDGTMADAGAATTAWRHLMIKNFGLKSRISEDNDPRNHGALISPEEATALHARVAAQRINLPAFLALCGVNNIPSKPTVEDFKRIHLAGYDDGLEFIKKKEGKPA